MPSSGMLRRVALVRSDLLEDCSAFVIRVTRIVELRTTLAITDNGGARFLQNVGSYKIHKA
jgi:hypothetical protein